MCKKERLPEPSQKKSSGKGAMLMKTKSSRAGAKAMFMKRKSSGAAAVS